MNDYQKELAEKLDAFAHKLEEMTSDTLDEIFEKSKKTAKQYARLERAIIGEEINEGVNRGTH